LLDPSDAVKPVILFSLLVLSAFLSASENALRTTNKFRMHALADDHVRGAKTASELLEEPDKMYHALLIAKGITNLSAASIATITALDYFPHQFFLAIGVFILLNLVLVEITPNTISSIYAEKISLGIAAPIRLITRLLTPVIFVLHQLSHGFMLLLGIHANTKTASITENELREILDISHDEGVIESEERRMITNVVDFGDSLAKDVMVPRIDMAFASDEYTYEELVQAFSEEKYTRLPVYSKSRDNVIGIVNLKDIFFYDGRPEDFHITDVLRDAYFTYEYKKTSELLIEMRRNSIPLTIVLNEYGATAGLITIEDLLEEIVGEIRDEYDDDEEDCIQTISENEYIADGNTKLDDVNESLGLHIESDDYDSIAGHIIFLLDHLPQAGETVKDGNVIFTVDSVDKNRIDKVHIYLTNDDPKIVTPEET
jgi:putative hemolysin